MGKQIKGYTAVFDNLDGSFDYICHADTEEKAREEAERKFDNERVRVYPYYDNPFDVL